MWDSTLSSVKHETVSATLLLWKWKLKEYIESSEWLDVSTGSKVPNLLEEYKTTFLGIQGQTHNFLKHFAADFSYL